MSITGSLIGYENNNEITKKSTNRSLLNITNSGVSMNKPCPSLNSSISNSIITTASSNVTISHSHHHHHPSHNNKQNSSSKCQTNSINRKSRQKHLHQQQQAQQLQQQKQQQGHLQLNSLGSLWYGVLVTLFQGYLAIHAAYRFLGCSVMQWKIEPVLELNVQIVLCGVVFILLPLFFASAVFKVGNLANDGIKLASSTNNKCSSMLPNDGLEETSKVGTLHALWTHGGPTAAFIHIVIAMCLLIPRLLLEARLIQNGFLPRENIWKNELDFLTTDRSRLVILSFMTSPYQNISINDTSNNYWDDDINFGNFYHNSNNNNNKKTIDHHQYKNKNYPIKYNNFNDNDAVEKFRPDNEFMESHENLEYEVTSTIQETPTVPITSPITTTRTTTTTTTTPTMARITQSSSIIINKPTKEIELNTQIPIITTSRITKSHKSENRRGNGRQGKKQSQKSHKNDERRMKFAEIEQDLGIKLERPVDFSRSNEFDFPSTNENVPSTKVRTSTVKIFPTSFTEQSLIETSKQQQQQTYQTPKTSLRDSDIHIVKPEKLPEIIPATPISTNSKIIAIKTKKVKRMANNELSVEVEPEYLIEAARTNITSVTSSSRLNGFSGLLQAFFGTDKEMDVASFSQPPSIEFLNLILALMVWSVRYPAVFWSTTKPFSTVFSIQMVANAIDIILSYTGISTLYKLQLVGQVLPIQAPSLLLNAGVTLALFILSTILVIASSLILYMYGHVRLAGRIRERSMISIKNNDTWMYFAHCASLCLVLSLAVVKAPLIHDLSATYRGSLDSAVLLSALASITHLFLWMVIWLGLTAKRRWNFKIPPLHHCDIHSGAAQPLLITTRSPNVCSEEPKGCISTTSSTDEVEDTIYWPKLTPSSPKLKVTFNEVTSTSEDVLIIGEHDGKRHTTHGATLCIASITGEADDGDYATLRSGPGGGGGNLGNVGIGGNMLRLSDYDELPPPPAQLLPPPIGGSGCGIITGDILEDNTSEEGKLLAFVRDDSVTYASTRDLEPPQPPPPPPPSTSSYISNSQSPENTQLGSPSEQLISPLAPVTVTVHTNEAHIASSSTPRCLRRADSGVPNEALTPRSDTTSTTESTTSPPERAPSETSSGVHSGEEREEVVIRPRALCKPVVKPPPPAIQEEPFGRSTNMKMSSFNNNEGKSSATLPLTRSIPEQRFDYSHCSTMPLPVGCHQNNQYKPQAYTPTASKQQILHTTLPNGVRYSNPHYLRRIPHLAKAESPYGHLGLGAGHHTFSKLLQDPLHSLAATTIPEDRDSANYSITSEQECVYANASQIDKQFS